MLKAELIETTRVRLAPFERIHLTERYVGWLNDPEVVRFSEQRHRRHDLSTCGQWIEAMRAGGHPLWAIEMSEPALGHIGNIAAYVDQANKVADVTILIGERAAWGRGIGAEAWRTACDWLIARAFMRKVTGGTMAANRAMVRIMERAGMHPDGVRMGQFLLDGRAVDLVHYARFATAST
jgi:RimJ/RimL family protein N-acetyltransferase